MLTIIALTLVTPTCIGGGGGGGSWNIGGGGDAGAVLAVIGVALLSTTAVCLTAASAQGSANDEDEGKEDEKRRAEQLRFVQTTLPALRHDAAAGGGEYVRAYGRLLGCPDDVQPELFRLLQRRYAWVFEGSLDAAGVAERGRHLVAHDPKLGQQCRTGAVSDPASGDGETIGQEHVPPEASTKARG